MITDLVNKLMSIPLGEGVTFAPVEYGSKALKEDFADTFKPHPPDVVRDRNLPNFISTALGRRKCHGCGAIIEKGEKHLIAGGTQAYNNLCNKCVQTLAKLLGGPQESIEEKFEDTFKPVDPDEIAQRVEVNKKLIQKKIDRGGYLNTLEFGELIDLLKKNGYYASGSIQPRQGLLDLFGLLSATKDKEVKKFYAGVVRIFVRKSLPSDS